MAPLRLAALLLCLVAVSSPLGAQEKKPAVFPVVYDVRELVQKTRAGKDEAAAAKFVQTLLSHLNGVNQPNSIQIVNDSRLTIEASRAGHADITALLKALERMHDVSVLVKAQLYEVDEAFYKKVKSAKRVDWEEDERQFLAGVVPKGESLPSLLDKQKAVLTGAEIKLESGQQAVVLSRHQVLRHLPSPEALRKGAKGPQLVLEGVALTARVWVSPDRRYVRIKLTETATQLQDLKKVKVIVDNDGKEALAEVPFLKETAQTQMLEIPDGGTELYPVQFQQTDKNRQRWLVLRVTPRIYIVEEEEQIRRADQAEVIPLVVAEALKDPRLQAARALFQAAGDNRVALIDSETWTWPVDLKVELAGHQMTKPDRSSKRFLGVRIDKYHEAEQANMVEVTLTLVNAGGGAPVGGHFIRYSARRLEKGWQLSGPIDP